MKTNHILAAIFPFFIVFAFTTQTAPAAPTVTFENQSGKPALVKLLGPTSTSVEVADKNKETVPVSGGHYLIKMRYGTPGKYRYTKGDEFDVTETATSASQITITLHTVVAGNYGARDISEEDFGQADDAKGQQNLKVVTTKSGAAGPWSFRILGFEAKRTFESPEVGHQPKRVTAQGTDSLAVIKVGLKRDRDFTAAEEAAITRSPGGKAIANGRTLFDGKMFVASTSFQLLFTKDTKDGKISVFSTCRELVCDRGLRRMSFAQDDAVVGFLDGNDAEATLVFGYDSADTNPILIFDPVPGADKQKAARISIDKHSNVSVEYGDLEAMRKYIPKELRDNKNTKAKSKDVASEVRGYLEKNGGIAEQYELSKGNDPDAPQFVVRLTEGVDIATLEKEFGKPDSIKKDARAFTIFGSFNIPVKGERWWYGNVRVFVDGNKAVEIAILKK